MVIVTRAFDLVKLILWYNRKMDTNEIRKKFFEFQVKNGHKVIQPAPLVLEGDPTTLFTGSGMQPLLPYLLGKDHPDGTRL
jgi:alanyl-tRNA synthetase